MQRPSEATLEAGVYSVGQTIHNSCYPNHLTASSRPTTASTPPHVTGSGLSCLNTNASLNLHTNPTRDHPKDPRLNHDSTGFAHLNANNGSRSNADSSLTSVLRAIACLYPNQNTHQKPDVTPGAPRNPPPVSAFPKHGSPDECSHISAYISSITQPHSPALTPTCMTASTSSPGHAHPPVPASTPIETQSTVATTVPTPVLATNPVAPRTMGATPADVSAHVRTHSYPPPQSNPYRGLQKPYVPQNPAAAQNPTAALSTPWRNTLLGPSGGVQSSWPAAQPAAPPVAKQPVAKLAARPASDVPTFYPRLTSSPSLRPFVHPKHTPAPQSALKLTPDPSPPLSPRPAPRPKRRHKSSSCPPQFFRPLAKAAPRVSKPQPLRKRKRAHSCGARSKKKGVGSKSRKKTRYWTAAVKA